MSDEPVGPKYIVDKDTVYEAVRNEFFTAWRPLNVPKMAPDICWNKAKIPYVLWRYMLAWCQISYEKFKSETLMQLFYDTESDKWVVWIPPQKTQGMTVQARDTDELYIQERAGYPDLMAGTLHHHCTTSAFQSGTDSSDEKTKEGIHFTIGKLGSAKLDVHARFCTGGNCYEASAADFVELDLGPLVQTLPETELTRIKTALLTQPLSKEELAEYNFEPDFKKVLKNAYTNNYVKNGDRQLVLGSGYGSAFDEYDYPAWYKGPRNHTTNGTSTKDLPEGEDEGIDEDEEADKEVFYTFLEEYIPNYSREDDEIPNKVAINEAFEKFTEEVYPKDGFASLSPSAKARIRRIYYKRYEIVLENEKDPANEAVISENLNSLFVDVNWIVENTDLHD